MMSAQRRGGEGAGGPSRQSNPNPAARKPKKKAKRPVQTTAVAASPPVTLGPIPQPYLAIAPSPVSSLSRPELNDLASRVSTSSLVLPSTYTRSKSSPNILAELSARANPDAASTPPGPSRRTYASGLLSPPAIRSTDSLPRDQVEPLSRPPASRRAYAAGLAAPPAIRTGAPVPEPRIFGEGHYSPAAPGGTGQTRRRHSEQNDGNRERSSGGPRRRSEDRLRDTARMNASVTSLGQIPENESSARQSVPQVLASSTEARASRRRGGDGVEAPPRAPQAAARNRRLTVSSREEGRALGVARGASMRRTNLWDDLPDPSDPPPPFPFPTSSSNRLPPTFAAASSPSASEDAAPPFSPGNGPPGQPPGGTQVDRQRSPPPTWEQAVGLSPAPPAISSATPDIQHAAVQGDTPQPGSSQTSALRIDTTPGSTTARESGDVSPVSADYASAPSSPVTTEQSIDGGGEEETEEERLDRRLWNADLLAGYSLEDRVRREAVRRQERLVGVAADSLRGIPQSSQSETPVPVSTPEETPRAERANPIEAPPPATAQLSGAVPLRTATPGPISTLATLDEQSRIVEEPAAATADESEPVPVQAVQAQSHGSGQDLDETAPTSTADASTFELEGPEPRLAGPSSSLPTESPPSVPAEGSKSTTGSDVAIEPEGPTRKLTRGKAIRRSSSGLQTLSPGSPRSPRSPRLRDEPQVFSPLFSNTQRDMPERSTTAQSGPATTLPRDGETSPNEAVRRKRLRRMESMDTIKQFLSDSGSPPASPAKLPPHREAALKRRELALRREDSYEAEAQSRDELKTNAAVRRTSDVRSPASPASGKPPQLALLSTPQLVSGPLIDLSESDEFPPPRPKTPPFQLTTQELLQLFETPPTLAEEDEEDDEDASSLVSGMTDKAESSAQAAARAATLAALTSSAAVPSASSRTSESAPRSDAGSSASTLPVAAAGKKRAPPPPPPIRTRLGEDGLTPKSSLVARRSIIRTATNPVTPRPLQGATPSPSAIRQARMSLSPTPTRRAPPPPPRPEPPVSHDAVSNGAPEIRRFSLYDRPMPSDGENDAATSEIGTASAVSSKPTAPPLPPRPMSMRLQPPVAAQDKALPSRPAHIRTLSAITSSDTASSLSEQPSQLYSQHHQPQLTPPLSSSGMFRSASRPRGPRPAPPPPPPRSWAKTIREAMENEYAPPPVQAISGRPLSERTHSDNLPTLRNTSSPGSPQSTIRAASEADLTAPTSLEGPPAAPRSAAPVEYTDLDVLVSRLEGSGREYEGFSQIATFLGPAKPVAASREALATLLPGPIIVDSRRVTAQGKVKLKLSLLGVRVSKCPICLAQYKEREIAVMLPECLHSGHEACVRRWFREDSRCFVCRDPLGGRQQGGVV